MIACLLLPASPENNPHPRRFATPPLPILRLGSGQVWERGLGGEGWLAASRFSSSLSSRQGLSISENFTVRQKFNPTGYNPAELLALLSEFSDKVEVGATPAAGQAAIYLELGQFPPPLLIEQAGLINAALQKQFGLAAAVGVATGKFSAYMAALSINPGRAILLTPGSEAGFLAPLAIDYLPLEPETARRLHLLGLKTMGQFVRLPVGAVLSQFGFQGRRLHQLAQGIDDRPLLPGPAPETAQATHRFEDPVFDRLIIQRQLDRLIATLAQQLNQTGQAARRLKVSLELEQNLTWQKQVTLRRPAGDPARLQRLCAGFLGQARPAAGVTAVSVQLADLAPAIGQQLELFEGTGRAQALQPVLADLVAGYGRGRFFYVLLTRPTSLLPEQRFRLEEAGL